MYRLIIILWLILIGCQDESITPISSTIEGKSYEIIENNSEHKDLDTEYTTICYFPPQPKPRGGYDKLFKYIGENIKWPSKRKCIEGKVFVMFKVNIDGSISDVEVVKGMSEEFDQEAMRVIRNMPEWEYPENVNNKIPIKMILPIKFEGLTNP